MKVLAEVETAPRVGARWGRYGLWQLGDYARGTGLATLVAAATVVAVQANVNLIGVQRASAVAETLVALGFLGSIFATNGLISADRTRGWYRFMFAKPASPLRYYAQAFALRGLGLMALTTIVWLLSAILVAPVSLAGVLEATAVQYALLGSITFLLSTVVRFEWLVVLVVCAAATIISGLSGGSHTPWWVTALHWILPPIGQMANITGIVLGRFPLWRSPSIGGALAWVLGYGAAAFGAALALLKRREWGR
jgi:hypothetical protein